MTVVDAPAEEQPPRIISTEQSSLGATEGAAVSFAVKAEDPQGSPLTFGWKANLGALGVAASNATTSSISWSAPMCLEGGADPTVTVTVTNDLSLSAQATWAATARRLAARARWATRARPASAARRSSSLSASRRCQVRRG